MTEARLAERTPGTAAGPVLIIEDHADTRQMVATFLECHGIPSVGADNGRSGLVALEKYRPSIILLDLAMPVMDGRQFRAAQQNLPDARLAAIPVVVMSAEPNCKLEGERLQAVEVLEKPVDIDRMVAIVKAFYCDGSSARES
jgi:CheY-like chemotaxis protein